jgi:hypothetical protein
VRPEQPLDPGQVSGGPFTAVVCHGRACGREYGQSVVDGLRDCVRRHRHGVLMSAGCLLGRIGCHAFAVGAVGRTAGALLMVQPCSTDRAPVGPALWVGPLANDNDVLAVRRWLDAGDLRTGRLPAHLRFGAAVVSHGVAN